MTSTPWLASITSALVAAFVVLLLRPLAPTLGLIDQPGGRKDHAVPVPLVGGIAVLAGLTVAVLLRADAAMHPFLVAAGTVALIGMLDDMRELHQVPRLLAQIAACLIMIFIAGVQLRSVGNLLGFGSIGLSILSVPVTVFAVVGVINAVNMSDGLDGLAGSQSLVALAWYAAAAALMDLTPQLYVLLALAGGLAAFLPFNLRFPWQRRARIFLGDAGSMLLGFALGWFAVDLTQSPGRTLPPICALWVVVIPLCDTVSLISRRLRAGQSPMAADRRHLHHLLLAKGFTVQRTVGTLAGASCVTGAIGIGGWYAGMSEPLLFAMFVVFFVGYHHTVKRQWAYIEATERDSVIAAAVRQ